MYGVSASGEQKNQTRRPAMHSAPSINSMNAPSAQIFVNEKDLALFEALIGRKSTSKTLSQTLSESVVMATPFPAPAHGLAMDRRQRISVWLHHVSIEAKKRIGEAR